MNTPSFFSAATGSRINRESGVIEGVSVLTGGVEAIGHGVFTDRKTLETFQACAETYKDGVRVKVNHGTGFDSIVGTLKEFRIEGDKLLADLHLLKAHDRREQVLEVAESIPSSVGLSVCFSGGFSEIDGRKYARCIELYSADLVDRPAVNPSGLFQSVDSPPKGMAEAIAPEKGILDQIKAVLGMSAAPAPVNFEAKSRELETQLSAKLTEFTALQVKVTELEAAKTKAETEFAAFKVEAEAKITDFNSKVEAAAGVKASAIMASLGVPPATGTTTNPGAKKDFAALVADQVVAGKSKGQATALCVKNHPVEYAEWRASGKTQTL